MTYSRIIFMSLIILSLHLKGCESGLVKCPRYGQFCGQKLGLIYNMLYKCNGKDNIPIRVKRCEYGCNSFRYINECRPK